MSDQTSSTQGGERHTAGAFDIRNIIGLLLGVYGVILLLAGLFAGSGDHAKTGGVNANLWTGVALLVVGGAFLLWAKAKPIVVPEHVEPAGDDPTRPGPARRHGAH